MHPFHEYLSNRLGERLQAKRVVVWYDPNREFAGYVRELAGSEPGSDLRQVQVSGLGAQLACWQNSFFELRSRVEPLVAVGQPEPLILYLPGAGRDRAGSVLMEMEKAGDCIDWKLRTMARFCLRQKFTDGAIDEMLASETLTYADIVQFIERGTEAGHASMLKVIFEGSASSETIVATWLACESKDALIDEKQAKAELYKLIGTRLGLDVPENMLLPDARTRVARYVLVNEFRSDLRCEPPSSIGMIPQPATKEQMQRIQDVAVQCRQMSAEQYMALADRIETELALASATLDPACLGSLDTFRFEEKALLVHCGQLVAQDRYAEALKTVEERASSFWVDSDIARRAQWEACRLMAELGLGIEAVRPCLDQVGTAPADWIKAYTASGGWCVVDAAQRKMEAWVAKMDQEPEADRALTLVRQRYENLLEKMTSGFSKVLRQGAWAVPEVLQQTHVYCKVVEPGGWPVAYFLVDAMRYEMGVELVQQLQDARELLIRPAVAALPTITPVGMAALLPGASASFSIVQHKDKLAARIEDKPLAGLADRVKFLKAKVPGVAEMAIDDLLQAKPAKLRSIVESPLVVIRSQDIDMLGENGSELLARQLMDSAIGNIARAIRELANAGVERFVIAADHGYQFSLRKEEDMRMDDPGGDTVDIHRRCWIGRGGATPLGAVRIKGAELGYDTDLDFIFPTGLAVFRTQGGLSYHHGGPSLQELIIPVISFRLSSAKDQKGTKAQVRLSGCPDVLTNRTFGVRVNVPEELFQEPIALRVILLAGAEQVGQAGMAVGAEFDRSTGCVRVTPGKEANLGMMLTRDDCKQVRVVVQDPATDAVLDQSDEIPISLGI